MKSKLLILVVNALIAAIVTTACNFRAENRPIEGTTQTDDLDDIQQVHPIVEKIFYNLPLEKSRLDLRELIVNDRRFILTDTTFNDFTPSSFFKGITTDRGLIVSKPDSIQVLLFYGGAALVTEKGGEEDFNKHPMILECKYFYSNKDSVEMEQERLLKMIQPIFGDTSSIKNEKWESRYSRGTQNCNGKILDHFDPYYRVAILLESFIPDDGSDGVFVLDIAFSKEDK